MRTCTKCGLTKAQEQFYRKPSGKCKACVYAQLREWRRQNPDRARAIHQRNNRNWAQKNPDRVREKNRRHQGIDLLETDFKILLSTQDGCCAICGRGLESGSGLRACVDHCHTTGRVRGILCLRCNSGLGQFQDDPAKLTAAIFYLNS